MTISNKRLSINVLFLLTAALAMWGCGGGDGGGAGTGGDRGVGGTGGGVGSTPIADAGADIEVSSGFTVNLDGSASSDPDGASLTYTWTQTKGPDVTGGTGALTGENPAFPAPNAADTLVFELVVNNGNQDSPADTVRVNVFEDLNVAYFVDGDTGNDETGTGSRDNPFATIAMALSALTTNLEDIYVKTLAGGAAYDEAAAELSIPGGTSLYGGYDADWLRDAEGSKTALNTSHRGVQFFSVTQDAWFSGFDLQTADSPDADDDVYGVSGLGDGTAALYVENNVITTGNVEAGESTNPGSNYGVAMRILSMGNVRDNVITVGAGGEGAVGDDGDVGSIGSKGANASGNGEASGGAGGPGADGGHGGYRGGGLFGGDGGNGGNGVAGSAPLGGTIAGGTRGTGGTGAGAAGSPGNTGGRGQPGGAGSGAGDALDDLPAGALFPPSNGGNGRRGGFGSGAGGGGGGEASFFGVVGGGGGGGGEGGEGGQGGGAGGGGGASIGVWLDTIETSEVARNTITSGIGGAGASGGVGGGGGGGGGAGSHTNGDCVLGGCGSDGADGGRGGDGGIGGTGGGGGGGPSYGVVFGPNMAPTLTGNTITSGDGAAGGNGGDRGNGGGGGYSFAVYDRYLNDNVFATLNQNTLAAGTPGNGGTSGTGDGTQAGPDGESGTRNWQ